MFVSGIVGHKDFQNWPASLQSEIPRFSSAKLRAVSSQTHPLFGESKTSLIERSTFSSAQLTCSIYRLALEPARVWQMSLSWPWQTSLLRYTKLRFRLIPILFSHYPSWLPSATTITFITCILYNCCISLKALLHSYTWPLLNLCIS